MSGPNWRVTLFLCLLLAGGLLFAAGTWRACRSTAPQPVVPVPPGTEAEENAVVRDALVHEILPNSILSLLLRKSPILQSESDLPWSVEALGHGLALATWKGFIDANKTPREWPASWASKVLHLRDKAWVETMTTGLWDKVQAEIPNAADVIVVSRPGFSADGKSAVLYYHHTQGPLSGGGKIILMRKTEQGWRLDRGIASFVF